MKNLLLFTTLLISILGYSQDVYVQDDDDLFEEQALNITGEYDKELAMTDKQELLFEKKVAEFLIKRNNIERKYKDKEKLDLLYRLQQEETLEMNNILTRPQMLVYKKIKPAIQPLARVTNQ